VTFDEALMLLSVDEAKLRRLVSEGDIRAFREGDQIAFRLTDVCNVMRGMLSIAPTENPVAEFHLTSTAGAIGITSDQLQVAIAHRLIPFGRVVQTRCAVPRMWINFWTREREQNTDRWREFLAVIARPIPVTVTEKSLCAHGHVIGIVPCPQCTEMAEAEKDAIVESSNGDHIRAKGCCVVLLVFGLKVAGAAVIGAGAASYHLS
jgi:hypothetical protein